MKRLLALILSILMVVTCFVACDDTTVEPDGSQTDSATESTPPSDGPTETPDSKEPPKTDDTNTPEVVPAGNELLVGFGREDITPPESLWGKVALAGYADPRTIEEVRDPLMVSCTAFRDAEGDTALVFSLDLHSMSSSQASAFCSKLTKEFKVQKSNIILTVTHTHASPWLDAGSEYEAFVTNAILAAARAAIADLKTVTKLYGGEINMKYYTFCRRYLDEDGTLYGVGYYGDKEIVAHETDGDYMIPVARFVREGGKDVILMNFASHCDTLASFGYPNTVSADYVGPLRTLVEEELDCHFAMQNGATGDLAPSTALPNEPNFFGNGTSEYGKNIGYKLLEELKDLPQLELKGDVEAVKGDVRVEVNHESDHLFNEAKAAYDTYYAGDHKAASEMMKEAGIATIYECMFILNRYGMGQYERRNIAAVSIGNIVFGVADYEMLSATGRAVKDAGNEKFDLTFMCPYSNGMSSYIAADYCFDNGGYEVYSTMYVRGTAEKIADGIIELIGELAE